MTGGPVVFDEEAWLRQLEDALARLGRGCRTVELVDEVPWGRPGTGTEGCDLTALREFLKLHPGRFQLQGNVVFLSDDRGDAGGQAMPQAGGRRWPGDAAEAASLTFGAPGQPAARAPVFEDGLWAQRVEAALEGFGGRCSTTDLADRLLWGQPGTGTEGRPLRNFLKAHGQRFGLNARSVWSLRVLQRVGEFPQARADFDKDVWLLRVRSACSEIAGSAEGAACLTRDLYVCLDWGSPRSQTYGAILRDFLRAHHHHFRLDGYHVYLLKADDWDAETGDLAEADVPKIEASGSVQLQTADTMFTLSISSAPDSWSVTAESAAVADERNSGNAVSFGHIEAVIKSLGGICSTTDIADIMLWGAPGTDTVGRSLRSVLHAHGSRVEVVGTLVYLRSNGPEGPERDDDMLASLAEAHVRTFGGTCTLRDLHMKLRWGRSPRTDHGRSLREFLQSQHDRFVLGGSPTPGSRDGRSHVSVTLRRPEADFHEGLWLLKVEAAILRSGGHCTTRDIYRGLGWGLPDTGTRGRTLREFLTGHSRLFSVQGFSIWLQAAAHDPALPLDERLRQVEAAAATWGWGLSSSGPRARA